MAAAVAVEKFERRIAVGAKKDRRRPRMSIVRIICGGAGLSCARVAPRAPSAGEYNIEDIGMRVRIRRSPSEILGVCWLATTERTSRSVCAGVATSSYL